MCHTDRLEEVFLIRSSALKMVFANLQANDDMHASPGDAVCMRGAPACFLSESSYSFGHTQQRLSPCMPSSHPVKCCSSLSGTPTSPWDVDLERGRRAAS